MRINYAIIFVSNMDRAVAFYRDVIGMPLKFASPHWTEFATEGAAWALHLTEEPAATLGDGRSEPAGTSRPGFSVPDLDAFHARMLEHKVNCPQPPKDTFGSRIAQYRDPDGLVFSVSEEKG
jgi:lactoylglutathione lyase